MRCRQILGALVLLALSPAAFADDLPRHGIIGLTVATPEPNKPANAKTRPPVFAPEMSCWPLMVRR
jgi:hypothetical protein